MNYVINHWHGRLSLTSAVWISLAAISLLGCLIEYFIHSFFIQRSSNFAAIAISYFVLFHVFVFVWQAVGVLRSCDSNIKNYISSGWTRSAQFLVLTSFAATIIWGISLGQQLWKIKIDTQLMATELKTTTEYSFSYSDNDTLAIIGVISPGITRQLKKYLSLKPDVNLITLNSPGGNIFEARGIAKLIQQEQLNTHVTGKLPIILYNCVRGRSKKNIGKKCKAWLSPIQNKFKQIIRPKCRCK